VIKVQKETKDPQAIKVLPVIVVRKVLMDTVV
jgi:hypothetical protein